MSGHLKHQLNARVSEAVFALVRALQDWHGLSQAGVLELLVREYAREHGISLRDAMARYGRPGRTTATKRAS
jgi:hypothetical protein